jgi:hypothetical protein
LEQKTPLRFEWRFLPERWRYALRLPAAILAGSSAVSESTFMESFLPSASLEVFRIRSPLTVYMSEPDAIRTLRIQDSVLTSRRDLGYHYAKPRASIPDSNRHGTLRASQVRIFEVSVVSPLRFPDLRQTHQSIKLFKFDHLVVERSRSTGAQQLRSKVRD